MARTPKSKSREVGTTKTSEEEEVVVFEYIKSALFRVIHSDGAIGGLTPEGNVHVAFFSDRPAIPRMQVHKKNSDGSLGPLVPDRTVTRPGIIREMDCDVILSPTTAKALATWLTSQVKQAEQRQVENQIKSDK